MLTIKIDFKNHTNQGSFAKDLCITDEILFELETRVRRLEVRKKHQSRKESKNLRAFPIPANSASIDALAETFGGDWSSRTSTDNCGTITNVSADNQRFVEETLTNDAEVESYEIIQN